MPPVNKEKDRPTRHRKVGAYRVLGDLGRGGMAQVYRGLHEALQREVALKELLADVSRDAEAVSRFRREALALAAFRHQNIVTLYDLVEKDTSLFMVMEYVDGPTLAELLRDGPLPPVVAAVIGARVASALDHAHFSRIIHRDIKPANVMITKAGEVKLMDFGIAKDESLEALTREGMAVGTPSYMSPEQVAGDPVDHRTDVYSLGVVLYECLGGVRPFTGKNAGEVFARIRDGRPTPLARAGPRVPKRLRRVVERAMRVNPGRRIQDAARMRHELEYFLARHVTVSHQALLVAFLKSRSRLTETEAMARLSPRELELADPLHQMGLKQRRGWWWAVALGVGGALYAASAFSPGLFGG